MRAFAASVALALLMPVVAASTPRAIAVGRWGEACAITLALDSADDPRVVAVETLCPAGATACAPSCVERDACFVEGSIERSFEGDCARGGRLFVIHVEELAEGSHVVGVWYGPKAGLAVLQET